jgi:iron complex outermembrane recepter protein
MTGLKLRLTLSCGCCLGALLSVPAFAQAASDAGSSGSEIVVTAQRRSENVQDVPMTVNAFSADQIAERGIANINDIAGQTPGLRFSEFANAGNISLRGIGTAFVSGNGESSVALYIDGVFIPQAKALGLAGRRALSMAATRPAASST